MSKKFPYSSKVPAKNHSQPVSSSLELPVFLSSGGPRRLEPAIARAGPADRVRSDQSRLPSDEGRNDGQTAAGRNVPRKSVFSPTIQCSVASLPNVPALIRVSIWPSILSSRPGEAPRVAERHLLVRDRGARAHAQPARPPAEPEPQLRRQDLRR